MKPELLLLHGALQSRKQFESLLPILSEKFIVHTMDFSGHAGKKVNDEISIERFALDVEEWMLENKKEQINIFGYSLGGYVGAFFASQKPEKVSKLMTLNTKWDWTQQTAASEVSMLNTDKMEEKIPAFVEQLKNIHHPEYWKNVVTATAAYLTKMGINPPIGNNQLKTLTMPVIIACGDRDKSSNVEMSTTVFRSLPNAHLCVFPNTGHPFEKVSLQLLIPIISKFFTPEKNSQNESNNNA